MSPRNGGVHGDGPGVVPIQSVERAATMLGLFSPAEPELTLATLVERLGMSRATVHRYGMSLRSTGLLRYDEARGTYSLGARVIELGQTALSNLSIIKTATPHLERLSEATNETVVLSIWDGFAPIVVSVVDRTDRLVSLSIRTGSRLPVRTSAQGRLFLAHSAEARAAAADGGGNRAPEDDFDAIRHEGLAVSDGVIEGITVVAAPILQHDGIVATIAMVGRQDSGLDDLAAPAVDMLRTTARRIAAAAGSDP